MGIISLSRNFINSEGRREALGSSRKSNREKAKTQYYHKVISRFAFYILLVGSLHLGYSYTFVGEFSICTEEDGTAACNKAHSEFAIVKR